MVMQNLKLDHIWLLSFHIGSLRRNHLFNIEFSNKRNQKNTICENSPFERDASSTCFRRKSRQASLLSPREYIRHANLLKIFR